MTAADEGGLQASGLRVEAGMDDGGIGFRGAGADIVGALEQHGAQPIAGQLATDGGADHAGTDDDDVVAPVVGHGDAGEGVRVRRATARSNRANRSPASAAPITGS